MADYVQNMIDRYKAMDPSYGSQRHQQQFIEYVRELENRAPCQRDHSNDTPPEHRYTGTDSEACYPEKLRKEVSAAIGRKLIN